MKSGFVSLVGRPNAGKSTLLNRIIGTKIAIVSDKPQTTRTRILGVKHYPDGQVVFLDTPGIHRPLHRMNVRMVESALATLREVDVVALVVDASERTGSGDQWLLDRVSGVEAALVLVLNKIDLIAKPRLLPLIDWYRGRAAFADIVPVSGLTGDGVDGLERVFLQHLPEGPPLYPEEYLTDQPERTLASEVVREKLLHHTRAEIPFTTAVLVDRFEEPDESGLIRIYCSILVESPSQKPIVVGRGGGMIKRIGSEARAELERFFGTRVHLDLHVKVKPDWRDDERVLGEIGLSRPSGRDG
jgi:GTP-binding protein Era